MAEIDIIVKINGVEYSQKELKKLAEQGENAAQSLQDTEKATKDLGKAAEKTEGQVGFFGETIDGIKNTFGKLKADAKGVAQGFQGFAKGLGLSDKASRGLAVGLSALGIPLLLAGLAAIIDYFKNFEAGAKLVEKALNVVGAVVTQLTKAFSALINLDFSGAADAISGIGDAASNAAAGTDKLFESARALEKLQRESVITNAKLKQGIELQQKVLEDTTQTYETRMAALKVINKNTEELAVNEVNLANATLENLKAQLALEKNYEKRIELEQQIADTQAELIDKQTAVQVIQFEAAKKERELQAERTAKLKEEAEKRAEIEKAFQEQLRTSQQNAELLAIQDADARAKRKLELDQQNAIREIQQSEFNAKQKAKLIAAINEDFRLQEEERQRQVAERDKAKADADAEKKKAEDQKKLDEAKANAQKLSEILQATDLELIENAQLKAQEELRVAEEKAMAELTALGATEEQKTKVAQLYAKKREALAQEEAKVKMELEKQVAEANTQVLSDAFGAIAGLVGENTIAFKVASIAQATIDTYLSAQKAYTSQLIPGDPTSPVRAAIAAGVAVAAGIANVRKIIATDTPGAKGGGGGSAPTATQIPLIGNTGTIGLGEAPTIEQSGAIDELTPQTTTGTGQQPVFKTYVVSADITRDQEKNKKLEELSRF